jgi:hypothetical protein
MQVSTPGDEARLSEQVDLLEACLKGAFGGQSDAIEPTPEDRLPGQPKVSSHHVKPA